MAVENKKVTDLLPIITLPNSGVMHVVDITNTSQSPSGSSFQMTKGNYLKELTQEVSLKSYTNNPTFTGTVTGVTKAMVGLPNANDTSDINKPISTAQQSALNLKADLVNGLIPASQLPSYVDDVLEFANLAAFPTTGETGKIYIAISPSSLQYRWTGSAYAAITNGFIASTNDVPEGNNNLYFTTARVLATALTGISLVTGGAIISTDTVLIALGKIQKQINDNVTALGLKAPLQAINDTDAASVLNVGKTRYYVSNNASFVDMVMQTDASTYAWVNIVSNTW